MKKFLFFSIIATIFVFSVSCSKSDANANAVVAEPAAQAPLYPDAETALAEGNRLFDENQTEKAIEAYKFATKLNPDLAEAHFKLGISYALLESEQELIVTPVEPSNSEEKSDKDEKAKKSNSVVAFENAVTAYKKILKENPKDEDALFNLGRVYDRLNQDDDSRKSLEQAVKLKPENSQYQTEFGAILIKLAQYDEAVRALKKAVEIDEGNPRIEDLLEQAQAGKKRVDFGADAIKDKLKNSSGSTKSDKSSESNSDQKDSDEKDGKTPDKKETDKKKESDDKKTQPKPAATQPKKPA